MPLSHSSPTDTPPPAWLVWSRRVPAAQSEQWIERMATEGLPNPVLLESRGQKSAQIELWLADDPQGRRLMNEWPNHHGRIFGGRWREQADCDWVASSSPPRVPLKIRDRLIIVDPAHSEAPKLMATPNRRALLVPTGMAFGTGDHATTATVLRWLVDEAKLRQKISRETGGTWSFLDVGCGTGILALAARVLGAEPVEGFDFDPAAVKISRSNSVANGIEGIHFHQADLLQWQALERPSQGWNVVAANVYGPVLVEAMPRLRDALAPGGLLLLSGILDRQEKDVVAAARGAGLGVQRRGLRGKWITLACKSVAPPGRRHH